MLTLAMAAAAAVAWGRPLWIGLLVAAGGLVAVLVVLAPPLRARLVPLALVVAALAVAVALVEAGPRL